MLYLSEQLKFHLYAGYVDMRFSFDGLSGIVRNELNASPINGDVFIFINKRRTQLKLLQWDVDGFIIFYKRLEKGTFEIPYVNSGQRHYTISSEQLHFILKGISLKHVRKRVRYKLVS
jgi:transposase